jgi:putative ABC transport system permease protein
VIRGVLRQTGSLVIAGGLLGVAGGLALSRAMGKLLFGLAPDDPFTFSASLAVLVGVALLASWLPARRASRLDPAEVLRRE